MSITYKGASAPSYLKVLRVTRSILPPSKLKMLEIDGMNGAFFISKTHGVRKIEVEIAIVGDSTSDLRVDTRAFAEWLDADKPEALVFSDEPDKMDFAILDGDTDLDSILKLGTGVLTFICPQPYSVGPARSVTGLTTGTKTVTYNGTAQTYPMFTVTFSAAQTFFEISNGTEKIRINASLGTTSTLVIDCQTGKVTINGVLNQQTISLDSDFFALKKGTNSLTISAGATVRVDYTEKFK
jgi:predicted phage tail component-like protein